MGWTERDICRLGYKELRGEMKEGVGRGRLEVRASRPLVDGRVETPPTMCGWLDWHMRAN